MANGGTSVPSRRDRLCAIPASALCLLAIFLAAPLLPAADRAPDRALRFLAEKVKADPDDFLAWNQLAERQLIRQRETGDNAWLTRAAQSVDASLKAMPEQSNTAGLALRARVDLAEHRFAAARDGALRLRQLRPDQSSALPILADALLELGELDETARTLGQLAQKGGAPLNVASRLARLALARGRHDEARAQFQKARDAARESLAPDPLTIAWCEVQLGELAFRTGDWRTAEEHYTGALTAFPEWWSAREHLAELRGAQGRDAEAIALYEQVIAAVPRPELLQAVGDLHLFLGRKAEAKPWHDRARDTYLRAIGQGSTQYFHHLAGFYCDSQEDPAEALKWARKDFELRQSAGANDALAWALYKNGDAAGAAELIGKALATGVKDPHLLYHAGLIRMSAGDLPGGQAALREAAAVNPHFQAFHVHR